MKQSAFEPFQICPSANRFLMIKTAFLCYAFMLLIPSPAWSQTIVVDPLNINDFLELDSENRIFCIRTSDGKKRLGTAPSGDFQLGREIELNGSKRIKKTKKRIRRIKQSIKQLRGKKEKRSLRKRLRKRKQEYSILHNAQQGCNNSSYPFFKVKYPKPSSSVYHIGVTMFSDVSLELFRNMLLNFKKAVIGDIDGSTSVERDGKAAQLTVDTVLTAQNFSVNETEAKGHLRKIIEIAVEEGYAIHLLLDMHSVPDDGWLGENWFYKRWEKASEYLPYQPCQERKSGGVICPYDLICENFQSKIIDHLKTKGLLRHIAGIFLFNEPQYSAPATDDMSDWQSSPTWEVDRAKALKNTIARCLNIARQAAEKQVLVGLKFSDIDNPISGWGEVGDEKYDPFRELLQDTMIPNKDLIAFDAYWEKGLNDYSLEFRPRLEPFLDDIQAGNFMIAEFGENCEGSTDNLTSGSRLASEQISEFFNYWPESRGFIFYAFNSTDCFTVADPTYGIVYDSAQNTLKGLGDLMEEVTQ
jgi:hypothetical protein